jgi:ketosteroid isomerase-like protein
VNVAEWIAARAAGDRERVAALLAEDVRYWDCERDELTGRAAVAEALIAPVALETSAVAGDDAVLELQVGGRYRSTEVYGLRGGVVVSVKAYFDRRP